jgi:hypothetical protein
MMALWTFLGGVLVAYLLLVYTDWGALAVLYAWANRRDPSSVEDPSVRAVTRFTTSVVKMIAERGGQEGFAERLASVLLEAEDELRRHTS